MPATLRQRILDLLAIGRVANLPTVWSNVAVGVFAAYCIPARHWDNWLPEQAFAWIVLLGLGASFAYLSGTFLNDWKDLEFDRQHRPERAIPSGRLSRNTVLVIAAAFGLAAAGIFALFPPQTFVIGVLLLGAVVVYTWSHKATPLAIIPMGLCRALLYLLGFFAFSDGAPVRTTASEFFRRLSGSMGLVDSASAGFTLLGMAAGLLSYVAGLSLAARYESRAGTIRLPKTFIWFLVFLPLLTHTWWWFLRLPPILYGWRSISPSLLSGWELAIPSIAGVVPFLLWTVRASFVLKRSIPSFVSRALAGICLVDLIAVTGFAFQIQTPWPGVNTYPLLLGLLPIALFVFSLALQRLAPAT